MILETKRLILRAPTLKDVDDIYEGAREYDVAKMTARMPHPYNRNDALDYVKRTIRKWKDKNIPDYNFSIELKSEKKIIGGIGLLKVDRISKTAETGSWINKKYWRNGYITEAKIALNDFAFNELKLDRLESPVYRDNVASNATQLKMGYVLEGCKRKATRSVSSGKVHDVNIYGLLKKEWKKRRPALIKELKDKLKIKH